MIRTLVPVELDLASSLSIRYACHLGTLIDLEVHPVYVTGPSPEEHYAGVGWARHTWEKEMIERGQDQISQLIASEADFCPKMAPPRVIFGDKFWELAKIMDREAFDLFVEGAPQPWTPAGIHKRLALRFYQRLSSPLIWLQVLHKINQVLVICLDREETQALAAASLHLWSGCPVRLHLAFPDLKGAAGEELRREVAQAQESLEAAGCRVVLEEPFPPGGEGPPPEALKDYGLVALTLDRAVKRENPRLQWLAEVKNPLMVVLL